MAALLSSVGLPSGCILVSLLTVRLLGKSILGVFLVRVGMWASFRSVVGFPVTVPSELSVPVVRGEVVILVPLGSLPKSPALGEVVSLGAIRFWGPFCGSFGVLFRLVDAMEIFLKLS